MDIYSKQTTECGCGKSKTTYYTTDGILCLRCISKATGMKITRAFDMIKFQLNLHRQTIQKEINDSTEHIYTDVQYMSELAKEKGVPCGHIRGYSCAVTRMIKIQHEILNKYKIMETWYNI